MIFACERTPEEHQGVTVCFLCGATFFPAAAIVTARIDQELLGVVCLECLDPDAQRRFLAAEEALR